MSSSAGLRRRERLLAAAPELTESPPSASSSPESTTHKHNKRRSKAKLREPCQPQTAGIFPALAATLAPELLNHILNFLVRVGSERDLLSPARVNRAWFHAAVRLLWRKPPLRPDTWQDFLYVLRRGGNVSDTAVSPIRRRVLRSVPCPIVYGSFVRTLHLSDIADNVTDRMLISIAEACPSLRVLNVERCQTATAHGIGRIVVRCLSLEQMDLTGIRTLNDEALREMFPELRPNVKNISLTLSPEVTGPGLVRALSALPNVERIWIQHCDMLRDDTIAGLLKSCPQLTDLSLLDCRQCTNATIEYIAHNIGPRLTQLTIGLSEHIRDPSIYILATHCRNLTGLTLALLRHITDASLISISKYLPNLVELGIFSSPNVTNTGVSRIATSCRRLERLCLYDCQGLTAEALVPVHLCLERLDYLNIEHCRIHEATPEIRALWKRCKDFYAGKDLMNALHIADLMYYSEGLFGLKSPIQLAFEIV
ncbi:hypothetical protein SpCBS45565_g02211 [Spizellomyces sp. 'palustris']|nr:hypothetical protein SpCBS45565_g02211 [Spizellomyces sp. 'palustris']